MANAIKSVDILGVQISCTRRADVLRIPLNDNPVSFLVLLRAHTLRLTQFTRVHSKAAPIAYSYQ